MNTGDVSRSPLEQITQLSQAVEASEAIIRGKLTSTAGKAELLLAKKTGKIPKWAKKHLLISQQFELAIKNFVASTQIELSPEILKNIKTSAQLAEAFDAASKKEIPPALIESLRRNQETVAKLQKKIPKIGSLVTQQRGVEGREYLDQSKLLTGADGYAIANYRQEWHLNLGLLMNVYKRTEDPALKKQISFLALNYLAKAAPINIRDIGLDHEMTAQLEDLFQFGLFQSMCQYHRDVSTFEAFVRDEIKQAIPPKANLSPGLFLTDTSDVSLLLPTKFSLMRTSSDADEKELKKDWTEDLTENFNKHLEKHSGAPDPFSEFLDPPLLLDLTSLIGEIQTDGDALANKAFEDKLAHYETLMDQAVSAAVQKVKEKRPELFKDNDNEKKLEIFMRTNLICICTSKIEDVAFIKTLPLFNQPEVYRRYLSDSDGKDRPYQCIEEKDQYALVRLNEFLNLTGLRLGGVRGREQIFNFINLEELIEKAPDTIRGIGQMVDYAVSGQNALYFADKSSVTESALFKRFERQFSTAEALQAVPPHARVLGQSTIQLVKGLLAEIDEEKWIKLNADPDRREIVQTSLFRITQHLAQAENQMEDFAKFTQAIELVHCEIATLLSLTTPFKQEDFPAIYKKQLDFIPAELSGLVKIGMSKSAMNVFAGINAAVKTQHPDLQRVHDADSYYEEVGLIGENRSTPEVLQNPSIDRVDLYVGEFNHNINIDPTFQAYRPGDIQGEIEALLKAKPGTEHLTVAVDCTIDFIHSDKAKALLKHFAKEIQEGKLNFVFFRSGQKFDMLGMDNYYGATFYMVNNGDKQWKPFDDLMTHDAFKTDPLSQQWFCLVNKHAPQATDAYRRQIFANTRKALDQVPDILKPGGNPHIRINSVDKGMDPCFIDIKITGKKFSDREVELLIHKAFSRHKAKIHSRGSFGFYHPNVNIIPGGKEGVSIRLNPGLNPSEVGIIVEFFNDLAKRIPQTASAK